MFKAPGRRRHSPMGVPSYGFYVIPATGSDGNAGTSAGAAWGSLAPLRAAIDALPDNGTLTALVSGSFLDDHLRLGAGVNTGVYAAVTVAAGTVFGATSGVDQSFTDCTGGPWTLELIGLGAGESRPRITGFDTGTGNAGGVTSNAGARLIYRNLICENSVDGFSLHGSLAYGEVYDCTFRLNSKSAFAHVHTGGAFTAKRCSFEGAAGAIIGIGAETTTASANSLYEDCAFVPSVAGDAVTFKQARLVRPTLGTMTLWVATTGGAAPFGDANGPTIIDDGFVNVVWDQNSPVNFTGCYGFMNIRQRNFAVGSIIDHCSFKGLAAGDPFLYQGFDPGSAATLVIRNTVLSGFGTAIGSGFSATNAGYFSASNSRAEYLCLFGNTLNVDADVAALGSPYVANNITSNPLLGPRNTTAKADWAIGPTGPCIGAGLAGADIGFRA